MGKQKVTTEELQRVELEMLKAFDAFCQKHDLRYSLGGGTMLGAIRHKGFIPWDDDIDVNMPRPDFMKFIELTKSPNVLGENYKVSSFYHDDTIPVQASTARIYDTRTEVNFNNFRVSFPMGCWMDIFAMDGLPTNPIKRTFQFKMVRVLLDILYCDVTKFGGKRRSKVVEILQYGLLPLLPVIHLIGYKRIILTIDKITRKYEYESSSYVGVLAGRAVEKEAMLKKNMEPSILVDFENGKFRAYANYDEYLTNLYGDYMTPPPEEKRVSRHEIDVYWK